LIEKVRENLALYSEEFDNAAWNKTATTVTANAIANPLDATLTADKIIPNTSSVGHFVSESITGGNQTQSVYAKAGEYETLALFYTVHDGRATFNLTDGTITETDGTVTASITSVGGGWYRCSLSTTLTTHNQVRLYVINGSTWADANVAGDGTSGIYVFGFQLETGDIATDYIPTTTAAVSVGMTADVPRLDYLGSSCPSLLLEPQRTNLALYSEQFDNAAWTKTNVTVTANDEVSPDGYVNADKLIYTSAGGFKLLTQSLIFKILRKRKSVSPLRF
jgi:hypothetical protein